MLYVLYPQEYHGEPTYPDQVHVDQEVAIQAARQYMLDADAKGLGKYTQAVYVAPQEPGPIGGGRSSHRTGWCVTRDEVRPVDERDIHIWSKNEGSDVSLMARICEEAGIGGDVPQGDQRAL